MSPHSSILAWKIPWAEEPVGLQSIGPQRVRYKLATEHTHTGLTNTHYHTGPPVDGIPQARTLEWVAISCSNA